mmetsp:Transcript_139673/g.445718  ORF Transcript_139673/g.445718 Transcript_139673/m.445718 type:complete len:257 (+) Transcript_139673:228-998(+)
MQELHAAASSPKRARKRIESLWPETPQSETSEIHASTIKDASVNVAMLSTTSSATRVSVRSLNFSIALNSACKAVFASSTSNANRLPSPRKFTISLLMLASASSASSHWFPFVMYSSWAASQDSDASFASAAALDTSSKRSATFSFEASIACSSSALCSFNALPPSSTVFPANAPRASGTSFKASGSDTFKVSGALVFANKPISWAMAFCRWRQSFLAHVPSFNGGSNSWIFASNSSFSLVNPSAVASASAATCFA